MSPTMDFEDEDTETDAEADTEPESTHSHLEDLSDGAGCTEIWEHLSEGREE